MADTYTIVVLADGETWTTLDGCSICIINKKEYTELCDGYMDPPDLTPIVEIALKDVPVPANNV
jgi:hypothetical protein